MNALSLTPFERYRMLRERETDPERQRELARLEHAAFAEQWTRERPINALSLMAAIPAYQIAKLFGLGSRTGTSDPWGQMAAGYRGLWEGLR